jgi:hypothetical protein
MTLCLNDEISSLTCLSSPKKCHQLLAHSSAHTPQQIHFVLHNLARVSHWNNTHPYTQYGPSYHTTLPTHWAQQFLAPASSPTTYKAASTNYKPSNNDNDYSHPLGKFLIILLVEHYMNSYTSRMRYLRTRHYDF